MNLKRIEYTRPNSYRSTKWNMLDIWCNMDNRFICFVSTDGKMVALEMQNFDEIINSNFYKSDIELDTRDIYNIVFWSHIEAERMLNE